MNEYRSIIDLSRPLDDALSPWRGDPTFHVEHLRRMSEGARCNLTAFSMGSHMGTHVDAPYHFEPEGHTLDEVPLDRWIGPCDVVLIDQDLLIERKHIEALPAFQTKRVLIKTRNSLRDPHDAFGMDRAYLSLSAAQALLERGIELVGVDVLSVEAPGNPDAAVHHTLLGAQVAIIEGLYLRDVEPGVYFLCCLPLKMMGAEGAPCRAVLLV